MSCIERISTCENRKRRLDNVCENVEEKRRKQEIDADDEWKIDNDDVTNCILNSWLNENTTKKELEVCVDTCLLDDDSLSSCGEYFPPILNFFLDIKLQYITLILAVLSQQVL
jgi:hypothetical protein